MRSGETVRIKTLGLLCAALAVAFGAGCGAPATSTPEEESLAGMSFYQRMGGSAARIFAEAKSVLDDLGFKIVSVRENAAINARLDSPKRPIHAYLKIVSGDRLYIRLYNLRGDERDEWTMRLFTSIRNSIEGKPAEKEKQGRLKRG
jgi:hypothetical protein